MVLLPVYRVSAGQRPSRDSSQSVASVDHFLDQHRHGRPVQITELDFRADVLGDPPVT